MTCSRGPTEDRYEIALVIHHLVRLRHRQGPSAVERAVKEAARLGRRFCENCGSEEPHDHGECAGCAGCAGYGFFKARKTPPGSREPGVWD